MFTWKNDMYIVIIETQRGETKMVTSLEMQVKIDEANFNDFQSQLDKVKSRIEESEAEIITKIFDEIVPCFNLRANNPKLKTALELCEKAIIAQIGERENQVIKYFEHLSDLESQFIRNVKIDCLTMWEGRIGEMLKEDYVSQLA